MIEAYPFSAQEQEMIERYVSRLLTAHNASFDLIAYREAVDELVKLLTLHIYHVLIAEQQKANNVILIVVLSDGIICIEMFRKRIPALRIALIDVENYATDAEVIEVSKDKIPLITSEDRVIIFDTIMKTGGTMRRVIEHACAQGAHASKIMLALLFAETDSLAKFSALYQVFCLQELRDPETIAALERIGDLWCTGKTT